MKTWRNNSRFKAYIFQKPETQHGINTIYEVKIKLNRIHSNTVHITWEYYL
jgi:hypothetical protein